MFAKNLRMRNENEIQITLDEEQTGVEERKKDKECNKMENGQRGWWQEVVSKELNGEEVKQFNLLLFKCVENLNIHQIRL